MRGAKGVEQESERGQGRASPGLAEFGQIAIINPEYIVCWGTTAAQNLLGSEETIGKMRGRFFEHGKAKVLCTYHPSYLLRNPEAKKPVWEDMKLLLAEMGLTPPAS